MRICQGRENMLTCMKQKQKVSTFHVVFAMLSHCLYKGMKQFNFQSIAYEISNNFATLNISFINSEMNTER